MTDGQPVRVADRLSASEIDEVLALAAAAEQADGVHPLSEDVVAAGARRRRSGRSRTSARGRRGRTWPDTPLWTGRTRRPRRASWSCIRTHRRRGVGSALLAAAGAGPLRFWAHGDEPAARAFADKNGFARVRVLWQMRRPLTTPLPDVPLPPGVTRAWFPPRITTSGRGSASTPGPSPTTPSRAAGRSTICGCARREPWFDPAGFLLAVDVRGQRARLPLDEGPPADRRRSGARRGLRARRRPGRPPARAGRGADRRRPASPGGCGADPGDALRGRVERRRRSPCIGGWASRCARSTSTTTGTDRGFASCREAGLARTTSMIDKIGHRGYRAGNIAEYRSWGSRWQGLSTGVSARGPFDGVRRRVRPFGGRPRLLRPDGLVPGLLDPVQPVRRLLCFVDTLLVSVHNGEACRAGAAELGISYFHASMHEGARWPSGRSPPEAAGTGEE